MLGCNENDTDVDIAIMVDCTGSMTAHVKAAKESVKVLFDEFKADSKTNVKFAIVTYTDLNLKEDVKNVVVNHVYVKNRFIVIKLHTVKKSVVKKR